MTSPRHQAWVFTLNNYTEEEEDKIKNLRCRYIIFGHEVGENGTPHLQGYIYFDKRIRRSSLAKFMPRAYLSPANGDVCSNQIYCSKGTEVFEKGTPPMSNHDRAQLGGKRKAEIYKEVVSHAEKGDMEWIKENEPGLYIQAKPRLESLFAPKTVPIDGPLDHEWWVGDTGTGKSRLLWELYPDHFPKMINKWWDGYMHEQVVAIEEWSPECDKTTQALKRWADRYPFVGEIKGGVMRNLRPLKIIVLSNYTIDQCFPRKEDSEPIKRRFTEIHFPTGVQHARFRHAHFTNKPEPMELEESEMESAQESVSDMVDFDLPDLSFLIE